jgi:ribosomal protein S18 acetylase RimI-like enzyme
MAGISDLETLIKVRFDYFDAEQWEVSPEQRITIEGNLRQYYENNLNANFTAAFVECDGEIASVAFLAVSEMPANIVAFPTGKKGTILNVLTYPEHRRKGYATSAVQLLIEEAKKKNLSFIELSASESGKPLYQKLGFAERIKSEHFTDMKLSL